MIITDKHTKTTNQTKEQQFMSTLWPQDSFVLSTSHDIAEHYHLAATLINNECLRMVLSFNSTEALLHQISCCAVIYDDWITNFNMVLIHPLKCVHSVQKDFFCLGGL